MWFFLFIFTGPGHMNRWFFLQRGRTQLRIYVPKKPPLALPSDDYSEMGSKFKACHIKIMLWWVSYKAAQVADRTPDESWRSSINDLQKLWCSCMCGENCALTPT